MRVLVNIDAGMMNVCSSVFTSDVILSCLVTCVQKEFEAIGFTASRKNFHFISNMLVGKIFFFDLKFVVFLKSVFCVWNRGVREATTQFTLKLQKAKIKLIARHKNYVEICSKAR